MNKWLGFPDIYTLHWYWILLIMFCCIGVSIIGIILCFDYNPYGLFLLFWSCGYMGIVLYGLTIGLILLWGSVVQIKKDINDNCDCYLK